MRKLIAICAAAVLLGANYAMADWVTLSKPGAQDTYPQGICNGSIVGYYADTSTTANGFLYNGGDPLNGDNWTTLSYPVENVRNTHPDDIDGNTIVGNYTDISGNYHGFVYDRTGSIPWITLDKPEVSYVVPTGISGSNIIGTYEGDSPVLNHGFLYNGTTWKTIDALGWIDTHPQGIDGNNVVGYYNKAPNQETHYNGEARGFLYDIIGESWIPLDMPGAIETCPMSICGNNIIGSYRIAGDASDILHGFLYDGITWTNIDIAGACKTSPTDIDGNNIVGYYGDPQGFLYTVPEPGTVAMLASAGAFLFFGAFRRYRLKN